jgi:hypothetical protein
MLSDSSGNQILNCPAVINELISLTSALKFIQKPSDPTQAIVDPGISNPAGIIEGNLNNILNRLEPLKSNIVKIK